MTFRQFLTSRLAVRLYVIASGGLLLLILLDVFIMPWIVHARSEISVPNLVGMNRAKAVETLELRGLTPMVTDTAPSSTVKPGRILYQNPVPGSVVREQRNVYLTVSGGEQKVAVPNLRGRSLRDAKITLEQLELQLGIVTYTSSELPAETVTTQGVPAGKKVTHAQRIDVSVSSGPELSQIDVPAVVNLSLDEAQKKLAAAGLRIGSITSKASRALVPNTVIGQSPAAGDKVDAHSPIDVTISH
ncbi:MAG: PASTA domain-containing protein [Ignavibacteria bacterium]|nr:PASTA domain-containing protein [Ignavibacteria bacterium]